MKKFGLHIHAMPGDNAAFIQALQPATVLVLGSAPGDSVDIAATVRALSPNTTIIYRAWSIFSPGDADNWESIRQHTPAAFLDQYAGVFGVLGDDVVYYAMNETGEGGDHAKWIEYCNWLAALVREANRRGMRVCVFNQFPGTPGLNDEDCLQYWREAAPVFHAIAEGGYRSIIGVHEYFAGGASGDYPSATVEAPYLVARYTFIKRAMQQLGLDPLRYRFVVTEYGYAKNLQNNPFDINRAGDGISFFRNFVDDATLIRTIDLHHQIYYDPDPSMLGTCNYISGRNASPHWVDYDLLAYPNIVQEILRLAEDSDPVPPNPEEPEMPTQSTPLTVFETLTNLNVRLEPATGKAPFATIAAGTRFVSDAILEGNGYRWRKLAGLPLFAAERTLSNPNDLYIEKVECGAEGADCTDYQAALIEGSGRVNVVVNSLQVIDADLQKIMQDLAHAAS